MARAYRKIVDHWAKVPAFLAALSKMPNITNACEVSGLPYSWVSTNRREREDFKNMFDEALQAGIQSVEDMALERAFKGYERGVYYQGKRVGTEYEPSDRLAEFILKANKPEKYREGNVTFNMGANSLVTVLSGMPRSDVLESPEEPKLINGPSEARPSNPD